MTHKILGLLAALIALGGMVFPQAFGRGAVAITGVTVIPMDRERKISDATVIVRDGKIAEISRNAAIPAGAMIVDGEGKFLIPGLSDMHAHLFSDYEFPDDLAEDELRVMLANGVTNVRLMIGTPEHLKLRKLSAERRILAPRIYAASPQLAGRAFGDIFNGYAVTTPEAAREAVRKAKADGYDFIKLTFFLSLPVYEAVIEEATKQDIPVIGHVDRSFGIEQAFKAGQQIEHLDGYFEAMLPEDSGLAGSTSGVFVWSADAWKSLDVLDESKIPGLAKKTVAANPYTVPTLTFLKLAFGDGQTDEEIRSRPDHAFLADRIREEMSGPRDRYWASPPSAERRRRYVDLRNNLVKAIHEAGGKVMAGSDAPEWFLLYGYTLHRELESLVEAGLSNYAALEAATCNPAEYLGGLADYGTIEPGKEADLVLLEADPLVDISNTRKISGVMKGGVWMNGIAIERTLSEIRPRFRAAFYKGPKQLEADGSLTGGVFRGSFTPDGGAMYFFKSVSPTGEQYRIFRSKKTGGRWGPAERVTLGGEFSDLYPAVSRDGKRMVFSSYRPVPGGAGKPNAHLWMSEWDGEKWGEPKYLGSLNEPGHYHSWAEFGWDGSLYFRRTTPDWRSTVTLTARWNGNGFESPEPFAEVEKLIRWKRGFNSSGGSPGPTKDLILIDAGTRDPLTGRNASDIWVSRKVGGEWSQPKPFGPTVNIGGFDVFPFFSPDGKTMYFVRNFDRFYSIDLAAALDTVEW